MIFYLAPFSFSVNMILCKFRLCRSYCGPHIFKLNLHLTKGMCCLMRGREWTEALLDFAEQGFMSRQALEFNGFQHSFVFFSFHFTKMTSENKLKNKCQHSIRDKRTLSVLLWQNWAAFNKGFDEDLWTSEMKNDWETSNFCKISSIQTFLIQAWNFFE